MFGLFRHGDRGHLGQGYLGGRYQLGFHRRGLIVQRLRQGVRLNDGMTLPCEVARIDPPDLWPRTPPIRERKSIPDSWLKLTIREGRNRQVRRMTAAVGLPTLRLVRWSIGDWTVAGIAPGAFEMISV